MLVKDYVEQESRKLKKEERSSFSKSDEEDDEVLDNAISMTVNLRSSTYYDSISMKDERNSSRGGSRRRGSISSMLSFDGDEQSQDSGHRRRGSSSFQQERCGSLSRRPSTFSLLQLAGGLSTEKKSKRLALMERRQGFDQMVNGMLGYGKKEPPKHPLMTRRGSFAPLSSDAPHHQQRRASMGAAFPGAAPRQRRGSLGSVESNNSVSEDWRGSFTGVVEDMRQLSINISSFVDDDDGEDEKREPHVDHRNEEKITRRPSASFPRNDAQASSASDPVEIETDGKVKVLCSSDDEEILVAFSAQPRRTTTSTMGSNREEVSDEEEAGVVETTPTRNSLVDKYANGKVFDNPVNSRIDYDPSDDDEEMLVDFPAQPRRTSMEWNSDDRSSDEEEASVVETVTLKKPTPNYIVDVNGEVFEKSANWIDYDSSSDDED